MSIKSASESTRLTQIKPDNEWRVKVKTYRKTYATLAAMAFALGISERTVSAWCSSSSHGIPKLENLAALARRHGYPLQQQLIDLELMEVDSRANWERPGTRESVSFASQLSAAVEKSLASRYTVSDAASAMAAHCALTEDIGRWRSKLYDVKAGVTFPHVGFHVLEFQRATGVSGEKLGTDADLLQLMEKCKQFIPDLDDQIESFDKKTEAEKFHERDASFREHYLEKKEIQLRIRGVLRHAIFNAVGGAGNLHYPLINPESKQRRHLYIDTAGAYRELDPVDAAKLHVKFHAKHTGEGAVQPTKLLLIAPPSMAGLRIGRFLGDALGWPVRSVREIASTLSGERFAVNTESTDTKTMKEALKLAAKTQFSRNTVLQISSLAAVLKAKEEFEGLIQDPSVLPVLLKPLKETSTNFENRQLRVKNVSKQVTSNTKAVDVHSGLDDIEVLITQHSGSGHILARQREKINGHQNEPLPWNSDSVDGSQGKEYIPEIIGDFVVRATYQVAQTIISGAPCNASKKTEPHYAFGKDSVLRKYETKLCQKVEREIRPLILEVKYPS